MHLMVTPGGGGGGNGDGAGGAGNGGNGASGSGGHAPYERSHGALAPGAPIPIHEGALIQGPMPGSFLKETIRKI